MIVFPESKKFLPGFFRIAAQIINLQIMVFLNITRLKSKGGLLSAKIFSFFIFFLEIMFFALLSRNWIFSLDIMFLSLLSVAICFYFCRSYFPVWIDAEKNNVRNEE